MNVLFACLSMLNTGVMKLRNYSLEKGETVQGILTNEAPVKAVISKLKGENQKLDKIVVICSKAVKEKMLSLDDRNGSRNNGAGEVEGATLKEFLETIIEKEKENARQNDSSALLDWELFRGSERKEYTTYEIYQEMVNCHAKRIDPSYSTDIYEPIFIGNNPEEEKGAISKAVIDAATKITDTKEEINLYIDYNGGQRYIALMMLAVANLMEIRSVKIKQILTMNSADLNKPLIPIQGKNMESVFGCFDLVSGINEYINYGRTTALKKYFKNPEIKDKERDEILNKMEEFANNLQLCRTESIMNTLEDYNKYKSNPEKYKQKKVLWIMLDEYVKNHRPGKPNILDNSEEKQDATFYYVVEDILNGYDKMRNGDLPEVIEWCVEHDFIQQALTFCSEEMPGYFWRSGIFKPSVVEEKAYKVFLEELRRLRKKGTNPGKTKPFNGYYKNRYDSEKDKSKYAFEWMINFLPHHDGVANVLPEGYKDYEKRLDYSLNDEEVEKRNIVEEKIVKKQFTHLKIEKININISKTTFTDPKSLIKNTLDNVWRFKKTNQRTQSIIDDYEKLTEIIVIYYLLKFQRNKTNHADDRKKVWTYDQICAVLEELVRVLQDAEKENNKS